MPPGIFPNFLKLFFTAFELKIKDRFQNASYLNHFTFINKKNWKLIHANALDGTETDFADGAFLWEMRRSES